MTTVRPVDPHDGAAFRTWYDTYTVGFEAGRTDPGGWTYPEARPMVAVNEELGYRILEHHHQDWQRTLS
jgi:hypothetical protein